MAKATNKSKRSRSRSAKTSKKAKTHQKKTRRRPAPKTSRGARAGDRVARPKRRAPSKRTAKVPVREIHCTLAPAGSTAMLLPTSTIAEITDYVPPAPIDDAPDWLLGQIEWEDWQVPVISYGALLEKADPESATAGSRIMVVKSLSSSARVPYIGVLVSQIPKLAKVSESELSLNEDDDLPISAHAQVSIGERSAIIPDLDRLAQLVGHAAYGEIDQGSPETGHA